MTKMLDFSKQFEQLAASSVYMSRYVALKDLMIGNRYPCANFKVATFRYGECLTVEISEAGNWTVLPAKLLQLVKADMEYLEFLNSMTYWLIVKGYKNNLPILEFINAPVHRSSENS